MLAGSTRCTSPLSLNSTAGCVPKCTQGCQAPPRANILPVTATEGYDGAPGMTARGGRGMNVKHVLSVLMCGSLVSACGASPSSPAPTPTPTPTPPAPAATTISGTVSATNGGQPLAGVSLISSTSTVVTDPAGQFTFRFDGPGSDGAFPVTISGSSVITRSTYMHLNTH